MTLINWIPRACNVDNMRTFAYMIHTWWFLKYALWSKSKVQCRCRIMLRLIFLISMWVNLHSWEREKNLSGLFRKVYINAFPFVLAKSVNYTILYVIRQRSRALLDNMMKYCLIHHTEQQILLSVKILIMNRYWILFYFILV